MPTDIKLKNSVTATNTPTSLQQGEVAINITDKKVWVGNAATTPVQLLGTGATGNFSALTCTTLTASGVATFSAGTVSAPAITTTGDTNTGIFFPAADTIAFTEGGVESMRIDSSGSLLVGQSTAAVETGSIVTAKNLEITRTIDSDGGALGQLSWVNNTNAGAGSGTSFVKDVACIKGIMDGTGNNSGGYITFETKADAGSRAERMRIDSSGNVGIGTSSPATKLEINGNGELLRFDGSAGQDRSMYFRNVSASNTAKIFTDGIMTIGSSGVAPLTFITQDSERMRISAGGDLQLGGTTTVVSAKQTIHFFTGSNGLAISTTDNIASTDFATFRANGSTCGVISRVGTTSAVVYTTTSDYRLKTVIGSVTDAGQRIDALEPIEYDWNSGGRTKGFLAHKFAEVYPNSVSGEKDAVDKEGKPVYQGMQASSSEVMADLIAEIQSLRKRVAQLESK
jgi:hypothetical protein